MADFGDPVPVTDFETVTLSLPRVDFDKLPRHEAELIRLMGARLDGDLVVVSEFPVYRLDELRVARGLLEKEDDHGTEDR